MFPPSREESKTKFISIEIIEGTGKDIYLNVFRNNGNIKDPFTLPLELLDSDTAEYGIVFAEKGVSMYSKEAELRTAEIIDGAIKVSIEPKDTIGMDVGMIEVRLRHGEHEPVSVLVGDIRVITSPTSKAFS